MTHLSEIGAALPSAATSPLSSPLYPPLEPYAHGWMDTGDGHQIYFEQCGNPQGLPLVVLHGGPASGCSPLQRRFFDPSVFRAVLFDQRGCGRSRPRGSLENNDTAALLRDVEQLRRQLDIPAWIVFGGSWGASLGIACAAEYPASCLGVVLRGTFLTGSRDLDWFFGGAGSLVPAAWQELVRALQLPLTVDQCEHAGHAVLAMLKRRLFSEEPGVAGAAAAAWASWEDAVSRPGTGRAARQPAPESSSAGSLAAAAAAPHPDGGAAPTDGSPAAHAESPAPSPGVASVSSPGVAKSAAPQSDLVDKYRVQAHYLEQQCFLGEDRLLALASRLAPLPVQMVHGRLDWVCRPANAWQVHQAIQGSTLTWVDHGGHNPYEPPMLKALGEAIERIRAAVSG